MHTRLSVSVIFMLCLLPLATPLHGQIPTVFDRSTLFVAGAAGFDPSETAMWHRSIGVEFGYRVAPGVRPSGGMTQWRFAPASCPGLDCAATATELGIGMDVLHRLPGVELLAGPRVGYILERDEGRFTWKMRGGAVLAPNRSVAPRVELSYWTDPDHGRRGIFATLGVHVLLGSAGAVRTAMQH